MLPRGQVPPWEAWGEFEEEEMAVTRVCHRPASFIVCVLNSQKAVTAEFTFVCLPRLVFSREPKVRQNKLELY